MVATALSPTEQLIDRCLDVAPITIALLIDSDSLTEIRAVRVNWIAYLMNHCEQAQDCASWQEAWELFWNTSHE